MRPPPSPEPRYTKDRGQYHPRFDPQQRSRHSAQENGDPSLSSMYQRANVFSERRRRKLAGGRCKETSTGTLHSTRELVGPSRGVADPKWRTWYSIAMQRRIVATSGSNGHGQPRALEASRRRRRRSSRLVSIRNGPRLGESIRQRCRGAVQSDDICVIMSLRWQRISFGASGQPQPAANPVQAANPPH